MWLTFAEAFQLLEDPRYFRDRKGMELEKTQKCN